MYKFCVFVGEAFAVNTLAVQTFGFQILGKLKTAMFRQRLKMTKVIHFNSVKEKYELV